jgi:hypothetical protein
VLEIRSLCSTPVPGPRAQEPTTPCIELTYPTDQFQGKRAALHKEDCQGESFLEVVNVLLRNRLNVNTMNRESTTTPHVAVRCSGVPSSIVESLLERGANRSKRNKYGDAPLYYVNDFELLLLIKRYLMPKGPPKEKIWQRCRSYFCSGA